MGCKLRVSFIQGPFRFPVQNQQILFPISSRPSSVVITSMQIRMYLLFPPLALRSPPKGQVPRTITKIWVPVCLMAYEAMMQTIVEVKPWLTKVVNLTVHTSSFPFFTIAKGERGKKSFHKTEEAMTR